MTDATVLTSGSSAADLPSDPADLTLIQAAARLRARDLSTTELLDACLRRIDERNGGEPSFDGAPDAVNAWARLYPDVAREHAREAQERLDRDGAPLVCGIPIGLKDLYAVAGLPLTASSRVIEDNVPDADAETWRRLRERGMVLVGHTHTHEFAAGGTTDQVGNPWSLAHSAGGSSGGSAAALAARMVPATLGSDTCGSVRIPAAACGISSIKPTHGRLPLAGIIPLAPTLDHPGPMARTIGDCSVLLAAMAADGPDVAAVMPPPAPMGELARAPRDGSRPLAGTTIAVTDRTASMDVDPAVGAGLEVARRACEELGARIVELSAPQVLDWDDLSWVFVTEVAACHAGYADRRELYRPAIGELIDAGAHFLDAHKYIAAQAKRVRATAVWEGWYAEHGVDLVLEPTLPILPPERGPGYDLGHAGGAGDPMIALTALWDLVGFPVACMPIAPQGGGTLPTSVSLVAPRGCEAPLVQAAIDLQEGRLGVPEVPEAG